MLLLLGFAGCLASLAACGRSPPTLEEALGAYRLDGPAGVAMLRLNRDGTWEYELEKDGGFRKTGRWAREAAMGSPSTLVIGLNAFELGFQVRPGDIIRPVYFLLNLEKID